MAFSVAGFEGSGGSTAAPDSATLPATTATPSTLDFLRKLRREVPGVSIKPPKSPCYARAKDPRNLCPRSREYRPIPSSSSSVPEPIREAQARVRRHAHADDFLNVRRIEILRSLSR